MFFWISLAFSMIQRMLAIWSLVPLPFLKPAWTSGSSRFTYCWSLAWRILSHSISKSHCSRPQVSAHLPSLFPQLHLTDALPWGPWTPSQASKQKLMPGSAGHCFGLWLRSILMFLGVGAHVSWLLGEFFPNNYLPSTHFHFESLRKNSLRPLSGCSYPFGGLSSFQQQAEQSSQGSWIVSEGTCMPSDPQLRLQSWSSPSTLKFLLGHSLVNCCLLFFAVFSESLQKQRWGMTFHGGSLEMPCHVQNFLGKQPHQIPWVSSLIVARDGGSHRAQRSVCIIQSSGWQVSVRGFCETLVVSPGISNHQKSWLPEGCPDQVSQGSRSEAASSRRGSRGSSKFVGHYSQKDMTLVHQLGFQWQQWHKPSAEASARSPADLWWRHHPLPFVDVLFHLEVKVGATSLGSWCKEFEDLLLLHLQDIEGSGHCESFLLSSSENPELCHMDSFLGSAERWFLGILSLHLQQPWGRDGEARIHAAQGSCPSTLSSQVLHLNVAGTRPQTLENSSCLDLKTKP